MTTALKAGWSKPAAILFASEVPANKTAFAYALAQAREFSAELTIFHVYDTLMASSANGSGIIYYDFEAAATEEIKHLQPLADQAREAGIACQLVARPGLPEDQILKYVHEHNIDRIIMGTHSPGPIGKLLVGSVAEAVLRKSLVPVFVAGPEVLEGSYRNFRTHTVLCAVSLTENCEEVVEFAARVAQQHQARLILEHVIRPQERREVLAHQSLTEIENHLIDLVPIELQQTVHAQAVVVSGDPTEELLYQSRAQYADLIVLGAHGASAFAAITRHGVVYKVLAHAQCPVLTLSPTLLAAQGPSKLAVTETYMAGVI
jgi:nucleotide-binding universal stress UspA family protein